MEKDRIICELLNGAVALIDDNKLDETYKAISDVVSGHPECVDERFSAELKLVMKSMEYRRELKEFSFLRGLSLIYKYCEMNYRDAGIVDMVAEDAGAELPDKDVIWWSWLQGLENAPEVVRCCYDSVKKLGRKIIILDENNISEYVSLPPYIEDKYQRGIISRTHYTDLVRMELLTERGGTWIDATAWISGTASICPVLEAEDLFMFRSGNVSEHIIFDSWFIQAKTKSVIFESTKRMLYAYWEKEDELKHYFLLHLMMTLACHMYPGEYADIPLFSNEPAHVLQHDMFLPYSEKRWVQIMDMSDVHKLTYKYEKDDIGGSFLEHVLNEGAT